jgi:hypothetical protein
MYHRQTTLNIVKSSLSIKKYYYILLYSLAFGHNTYYNNV